MIVETTVEKMCHYCEEVDCETVNGVADRVREQIVVACQLGYPQVDIRIFARPKKK